MKKPLLLLAAFGFATCLFAQGNPPGITAVSLAYHNYRLTDTVPSFELAKVRELIKHIKPTSGGDMDSFALPAKQFNALSVPARFTYCMIHCDQSNQNCSGMPAELLEETKIFAQPSAAFNNEGDWTPQQTSFLHHHRSQVIALLRSTIRANHRVGVNLKKAIVELNAYELIPDMVAMFKRDHKDQDILSVFCVLMKTGKYPPFLKSQTYRKLYGPSSNYMSFIQGNAANQTLTVQRALAYYSTRKS